MHNTIKNTICICLISALLLCAMPTFAYTPTQRFSFAPIAYEGEILDALPCSEGVFAVKNESFQSGFISAEGKLVIPFSFANAGSFQAGLAPAAVAGGKYGYIGRDGLFEIAPAFDSADNFSSGLARVEKDTKTFYIDRTGKAVTFASTDGFAPLGAFKDGVCWVGDADGLYHLLDASGAPVFDYGYTWADDFSEGVCWASPAGGDDFLDFEIQLIDAQGNILIPCGKYSSASAFKDGVCWAKRSSDDTLVLIDTQGEELFVAPRAEGIPTPYTNGLSVGLENNLFTVRNAEGVVIYSSLSYRAVSYGGFSEGNLLVQDRRDGKYYIMHDTAYEAVQAEEEVYTFDYAPAEEIDADFEIVLHIGSPLALVSGQLVYIDAENPNVKTFTQNGRTLVPMRFLSERLPGWSITWDYLSESALLKSDAVAAGFKDSVADLSYIRYNTEKRQYDTLTKTLDQPPVIADGRMFLPVRALSELMDVNVFYDARGLVVFSNTRDTLSYEEATELLTQLEQGK